MRKHARWAMFGLVVAVGCAGGGDGNDAPGDGDAKADDARQRGSSTADELVRISKTLNGIAMKATAFQLRSELDDRLFEQMREYQDQRLAEANALRPGRRRSESAVLERAASASIVMISDIHNVQPIQRRAIAVLEHMMSANDRPKTFLFELIDANYQADVDAFMAGTVDAETLRATVKWEDNIGYAWEAYLEVLEFLKAHRIRTLVCMRPDEALNLYDVRVREQYVFDLVEQELRDRPETQVLLLHGQAHLVGRTHLQDMLARRFPGDTMLLLTFVSSIHWQLLARGDVLDDAYYTSILGGNESTYYFYSAPPAVRDVSVTRWIAGNLNDDEAITAALGARATATSDAYQTLIDAVADPSRAPSALLQFRTAAAAWATDVTAAPDPKGLLPTFEPELGELRALDTTAD